MKNSVVAAQPLRALRLMPGLTIREAGALIDQSEAAVRLFEKADDLGLSDANKALLKAKLLEID